MGDSDPSRIAGRVAGWANQGVTSLKAYTGMRAPELKAAIDAAHERGMTVAGHLCAVGFREAAEIGIDQPRARPAFDTEFYSQKQADECPDQGGGVNRTSAHGCRRIASTPNDRNSCQSSGSRSPSTLGR
jgi:hypothetical protein